MHPIFFSDIRANERTKILHPFFSRHYFHQSKVLIFKLVLSEGRVDEAKEYSDKVTLLISSNKNVSHFFYLVFPFPYTFSIHDSSISRFSVVFKSFISYISFISYHIISYITSHHTIYHIIPHHTIYHIIPHHIIYHIMSYHIIFIHLPLNLYRYRNSHNNT